MRGRPFAVAAVVAVFVAGCGDHDVARPGVTGTAHPAEEGKLTPKTASGRSNEAAGAARVQARTVANTPCGLVTRTQASHILGERIHRPQEAAQGPTCVYRGRTAFATVAIQTIDFDKVKPKLGRPQRLKLAGRVGYCGNYGQQMLYVPLTRGSVLAIAAPCDQAKQFARLALRELNP